MTQEQKLDLLHDQIECAKAALAAVSYDNWEEKEAKRIRLVRLLQEMTSLLESIIARQKELQETLRALTFFETPCLVQDGRILIAK